MAKVSKKKAGPAYLNPDVPLDERVKDLMGRMTLEEKLSQIITPSPAIPRLKVPAVKWHNECLHGLVHAGKATQFPQAIGFGATFDTGLIQKVADAIASEARAKYHDPLWHSEKGPRVGINFWTPNINIFRDPRWGRGQETYGEDPYLTGAIGAAFVKGLQGSNKKFLKTAACAKHYAAHSGPEALRSQFDAQVSQKDLYETYLPAFKALVDAGVETVMATYNRVNGEPCPGSHTLLKKILRDQWHFNGHVVSDGGAIGAIHSGHKVTANALESAAMCVKAGCDLCNEGNHPAYEEIPEALRQGLITQAEFDECVHNVLRTQFRLGLYDDPKTNPYTKINGSVIQCKKHIALARETAEKSIVMVKNNGILPFTTKQRTICVCGPTAADMEVLMGNFYRGASPRFITILEGITGAAPEGTAVTYLPGAYPAHPNLNRSSWHLGLCDWADAIVGVVGITPIMEGEAGECIGNDNSGDRRTLDLPEHQKEFIRGLLTRNKPVILIVTGGSPVLLTEFHDKVDAILYVFYPGEQGGLAVGDVVFGHVNPSGRLPVTYPKSTEQLPDFADYSLENRGYRYMKDDPLYPFGFGLSYTKFEYGKIKLSASSIKSGESIKAEVKVTNNGKVDGEEVVQLYITDNEASTRAPKWCLKTFKRISLKPKKSASVVFEITPEIMALINEKGDAVVEPGKFTLWIGGSSPGKRSEELGAAKMAIVEFEVK